MIEYPVNYEHTGDSVIFKNNIRISSRQFDALNRVRGKYTCDTTSFFWHELIELANHQIEQPAEESNFTLQVLYEIINYKRIRKEMEYLAESGFFKLKTDEISVKNRTKMQVNLTEIHPALLSIIVLM